MSRRDVWLRGAASAVGCVYLWLALGPLTLVMPRLGLDASWQSVIVHAWVAGWQWGVDVIDNFGPYGFLYAREFHPDAAATMLIVNAALAAVLVVAWRSLVGGLRLGMQALLSLGFLFAMAGRREVFYLSFPLLLALAHFREPRPVAAAVRVALVLATALAGLIKWTFPVVGLTVLALLDVDVLRRRRWPWHLALGLAAMAALYLASGQKVENLQALFTLTADQTAGFADAMAFTGPFLEIPLFLGLTTVGLGVVLTAFRSSLLEPLRRLLLFLVLLAALFVGFKIGFVRHDATHSPSAWNMLGLVLIGCYVVAAADIDRYLGVAMVCVALFSLAGGTYYRPSPSLAFAGVVLVDEPLANARNVLGIAADWPRWKAATTASWQAARARIREQRPLPQLDGAIDSVPPLQANILAWSLDYRPRPTLQEHQAYTPLTLAADEAFFVSGRAPEYLLFRPGSIDGRYPSLTEGALWPLLLSRYRTERRLDDVLLLERLTSFAEPFAGSTSRAESGDWDQRIPLRPEEATAAFVRIHLKATMLGRLVGFLFRPALVSIEVRLNDGRQISHRLPRGLAAAGFLLSPYVAEAIEYESLAGAEGEVERPAIVTEFRLSREDGREMEFEPGFDIEVTRLNLQQTQRSSSSRIP